MTLNSPSLYPPIYIYHINMYLSFIEHITACTVFQVTMCVMVDAFIWLHPGLCYLSLLCYIIFIITLFSGKVLLSLLLTCIFGVTTCYGILYTYHRWMHSSASCLYSRCSLACFTNRRLSVCMQTALLVEESCFNYNKFEPRFQLNFIVLTLLVLSLHYFNLCITLIYL